MIKVRTPTHMSQFKCVLPTDYIMCMNLLQGAFEVKSHKSLQMLLDCLELDPSTFVRVQVSFNIQVCYNNCSVYSWEVYCTQ